MTNSMGRGIPQTYQMSKRSLAISSALNPSIPHHHQVMPTCAATLATRVEGVHRHTSICILARWGTSKCTYGCDPYPSTGRRSRMCSADLLGGDFSTGYRQETREQLFFVGKERRFSVSQRPQRRLSDVDLRKSAEHGGISRWTVCQDQLGIVDHETNGLELFNSDRQGFLWLFIREANVAHAWGALHYREKRSSPEARLEAWKLGPGIGA